MNTYGQSNFSRTSVDSRDQFVNLERELKISKFSQKTIKSYLYYNRKFLEYTNKSLLEIRNDDIKNYLEYSVDKNFASSSLNIVINALKFYYTQILKRRFFLILNIPKRIKNYLRYC